MKDYTTNFLRPAAMKRKGRSATTTTRLRRGALEEMREKSLSQKSHGRLPSAMTVLSLIAEAECAATDV